jgi:tRNA G10  N-methylase Trm11
MQVGMMPAKLAHIMLNMALTNTKSETPIIRDPFCGTGTTMMLANHFGYDTVGSDIETKRSEKNMSRRSTQPYATKHTSDVYTQDATKPFENINRDKTYCIVSE